MTSLSDVNAPGGPRLGERRDAYVTAAPAVAISTPPIAGPAMCATLWTAHCSALADVSSSRSMSRGISASSGGRRIAVHAAISAVATYSTQSRGSGSTLVGGALAGAFDRRRLVMLAEAGALVVGGLVANARARGSRRTRRRRAGRPRPTTR